MSSIRMGYEEKKNKKREMEEEMNRGIWGCFSSRKQIALKGQLYPTAKKIIPYTAAELEINEQHPRTTRKEQPIQFYSHFVPPHKHKK